MAIPTVAAPGSLVVRQSGKCGGVGGGALEDLARVTQRDWPAERPTLKGRIAWDYRGSTTWFDANLQRLCQGTSNDMG